MTRFDLQHFADAAEAGGNATGTDVGAGKEAENPAKATDAAQAQKDAQKTGEAKYTDADLDRIINRKFAEMEKKKQKEVDEAKKLAEMNATQKAEYQRDQLQKELDALKKSAALADMTKTARKMLSDGGINIPEELLSVMVTTDAEQTKAAVDSFAQFFNDAVEAKVKERLKGEPPRKGSGSAAPMTKEQIMAIRDPELRQKKMLENKELFNF